MEFQNKILSKYRKFSIDLINEDQYFFSLKMIVFTPLVLVRKTNLLEQGKENEKNVNIYVYDRSHGKSNKINYT